MIDDTLLDAEERMDKALSVAREDLGSVRTGRAAPSMFNKVLVDYYGAPTPVPADDLRELGLRPAEGDLTGVTE